MYEGQIRILQISPRCELDGTTREYFGEIVALNEDVFHVGRGAQYLRGRHAEQPAYLEVLAFMLRRHQEVVCDDRAVGAKADVVSVKGLSQYRSGIALARIRERAIDRLSHLIVNVVRERPARRQRERHRWRIKQHPNRAERGQQIRGPGRPPGTLI